jgi:DNA-binding transcriptional ArsR family regulator
MSINTLFPDYEIDDRIVVTTPAQLRAMGDQLRTTLLDLLLERAATVAELATAVARPKSTVAHHVKVLLDAGLLRVVRTRRVRAIDERFYGRTALVFAVGAVQAPAEGDPPRCVNALFLAATESVRADEAGELRTSFHHARIPAERAAEFWERIEAVTHEFTHLPRDGDTVFAFATALYPTSRAGLPEPD